MAEKSFESTLMEHIDVDIKDIIKSRSSWRTYKEESMEPGVKNKLEDFLNEKKVGPFGSTARFTLIDLPGDSWKQRRKFGTYGFIKGAQHYIAGAVSDGRLNLEDYAYLFEEIILYATYLNLGTCWLGGTFKRSEFAQIIDLKSEESLPAISPVGYIPNKRRLVGRVMRWAIKAKKRKPWEELFFIESFNTPMSEITNSQYMIPLEMVRIAPSAKNKQPWRLVIEPDHKRVHFLVNKENEGEESGIHNYQRLDMGNAMCHFNLASQSIGLKGNFKHLPETIKYDKTKYAYSTTWQQL